MSISDGRKSVETELYIGPHYICELCDGTGIQRGQTDNGHWAIPCGQCGGRGVTKMRAKVMEI